MPVPYRTFHTTLVCRRSMASIATRSSMALKSQRYRRVRHRPRCHHSWAALLSAAMASATRRHWARITTTSSQASLVRAPVVSSLVTDWSSHALSATRCSALRTVWKCTPGARTLANGLSLVRCAIRHSATRSVCRSTGRCTRPRRRSSASSAANSSSARPLCPLTYWSTLTRDPTRASNAANDSTRSRTWRNTPTFTQVWLMNL